MKTSKIMNMIVSTWMLLALLNLAACGMSSGEDNAVNPQAPQNVNTAAYTGPAPADSDAQNFMISFWSNISRDGGRCAQCHNSQSTRAQNPHFADRADVNVAYRALMSSELVNLDDPGQSALVEKVAGGHGCWHNSPVDCAATITTWITKWAGGAGGSATEVVLRSPEIRDVSASKEFPADSATFASTIYTPILREYCSECHVEGRQTPYIASANVETAYAAAQGRINLVTPRLSRLVERLRNDFHHCWDGDCEAASIEMQNAIAAFANPLLLNTVDPELVISKALTLTLDGIPANAGGRFEDNIIAKYEFKTGSGFMAYDTSGVEPALDLTLSGNTEWVGGWGVRFNPAMGNLANGKAQGSTSASAKLFDKISETGEYTLEAWLVPGNVNQEDAHIISYAGSSTERNFTLGQHEYNYEVLHRTSTSVQTEAVSTPDADRVLQATLQHVVVTYTPSVGRRIYVNGQLTRATDDDEPGTFANWNSGFAFALGTGTWQGTVRMVAIHNRILTPEQITQNHAAGVGEKFFMLFSISDLINVDDSFIVFEVSQFDTYSYLFTEPFFVSLSDSTELGSIQIEGMQIGINGALPANGQAYKNLVFPPLPSNYTAPTRVPISSAGTILELQRGADEDEMFLSFERIGSHLNEIVEPPPTTPPEPADGEPVSDIGLKTFDEINASMAMITGIPKTNSAVATTFATVRQQLPSVETIEGFVSAQQMGITQLAIQHCDELVDSSSARAAFFGAFDFSAPAQSAFSTESRALIINPLLERGLSSNLTAGLSSQPADADVRDELNSLMDKLLACGGSCNTTAQTANVVKASCAAVLGSAAMLIQ